MRPAPARTPLPPALAAPPMRLTVHNTTVEKILTRTSGYLRTVASHSLQPYRGCSFGQTLCGAFCYVQHSRHLLSGRPWGTFLDVRTNAAASYLRSARAEAEWARRTGMPFGIFLSSVTDPFPPQEKQFGVTAALLEAMRERPPQQLIVQTHSPLVTEAIPRLRALQAAGVELRVQVTIETDRERLPGLPAPPASVRRRFEACRALKAAGLRTVVAVAPLLPIQDSRAFFRAVAEAADAVVIDHFVGGDGSARGTRTLRTALPDAMKTVEPRSVTLEYRDEMVLRAREFLPGRVGVGIDGFAGRYA